MSDAVVINSDSSKKLDLFSHEKEAFDMKSTTDLVESDPESDKPAIEEEESKSKGGGGVFGVLAEYSENTNFHGFRYIFAAYTIFGRVCWLLIFLIALGGLIYQTLDRVNLYNTRPVNVNIDVKRASSLLFPAVVMCNTNQYRMTVAEKMDVYNGIKDYYSSPKNGTNADNKVASMDFRKLSLDLGHQKNDFIYDCKWGSERCGLENFTREITDFGVCVTFNDGKASSRKLDVHTKGETFGLKVVLNLEQYEYMAGPNAAAGIKLLLYNESDFPRVRDLGLAIPPASNTLIAFKVNTVSNVKPPYGKCGEAQLMNYQKYAESSCEVECLTKLSVDTCGCRGIFMTWNATDPNPPPYCTLEQTEDCLSQLTVGKQPDCDCPIPCHESTYATTVSYSAISDFEAANQAVYINTYQPDIVKKFRAGRVSWMRLDDESVSKDTQQIKKIYAEAMKMNDAIADPNNSDSTKPANATANSTSSASAFMTMLDNVEKEVKVLTSSIEAEVVKVKDKVEAEVNTFKNTMDYEATSMIMFDIQNFLGREVKMLYTILNWCFYYAASSFTVENTRKISKPRYNERMGTIKTSYMGKIDVLIDILETVSALYTVVIQEKWNGTWNGEKMELPEALMMRYGNQTLELLTDFQDTVTGLRDKLKPLDSCLITLNAYIPDNKNTALNAGAIRKQSKLCRDQADGASKYIMTQTSQTYKMFLNVLTLPQNRLGEESTNLNRLNSNLAIAANNMYSSIKKFHQIQEHPELELPNMVKLIQNASELNDLEPRWRQLSKEQLALDYSGDVAYLAIEKAVLEKKDFIGNLDLSMTSMRDVQNLAFTVLDAVIASQKSRKENGSSTTLLRDLIAKMPSYIKKVKVLKDTVDVIVFTLEYRQFVENLKAFRESLQVNKAFYKENFLTVSIYFQDLQHHGVTQQEGYTWFGLLCDVGGTAGLFIGASLLSIIELLYFVTSKCVLACFGSCMKKKAVGPEEATKA